MSEGACEVDDEYVEMPEYAQALVDYVWDEIGRVYWNKNQQPFDMKYGMDPSLLGVAVRPYYWGDDDAVAALPNLEVSGLRVKWYKYMGRGMECSERWSPKEWISWFDDALVVVRANERSTLGLGAP